jgi:hypothetical protein
MDHSNTLDKRYFLSDEQVETRMSICRLCEHRIEVTNMCGKCFCFLPWKLRMAPASCPEGKWMHVTVATTS